MGNTSSSTKKKQKKDKKRKKKQKNHIHSQCPPPQIKVEAADSGHPSSTDSLPPQSVGTSEGSQELESVLTEQMRTLEREKHDLTADLSTLNLAHATSEDDNYSTDDLDASSVDDLDACSQDELGISFDMPASPSRLNHLNKNRAPKQKKRPPARFSAYLTAEEVQDVTTQALPETPQEEEPTGKIKKKRGSKDKKKKKGKYKGKSDHKTDDSVVEL